MSVHEWRRELLIQRFRDINSVPFTLKGNDYDNYGAPSAKVEQLIKDAIGYVESDELDKCECACLRAEKAQIAAIQGLCRD